MTIRHTATLLALSGLLALPASANLLEDSQGRIELRNMYFNRDFRQTGAPQSKADEWAQGVRAYWQSGYTDGRFGVGLDAMGLLGIKLDSSSDRSGTGLLKRGQSDNRAKDESSQLGLTAKLRLDNHVLRVGTLLPQLPLAMYNDSRLLPQTFRGGWLQAKGSDALSFDLGRFDAINLRDSADHQRMTPVQGGARNVIVSGNADSNAFDFAGASYRFNDNTRASYYYGELDGLYRQHYLVLNHSLKLGDGQLESNLRYADSSNAGRSNIDNRMTSLAFSWQHSMHRFGTSYQQMNGRTGFAYLNGTDPFLTHLVQINDFANRDERSWQVRHDYSFANLGLPGLSLMNRYTHGDNITLAAGQGSEWERNTDLAYTIQSGPLKNLSLHWRNATYRSSFASDMDENRLIAGYVISF
tara:strand:+ start:8355 stop:9593 length:1239 start_codon:yes stop_codon:yes gene_type:complete